MACCALKACCITLTPRKELASPLAGTRAQTTTVPAVLPLLETVRMPPGIQLSGRLLKQFFAVGLGGRQALNFTSCAPVLSLPVSHGKAFTLSPSPLTYIQSAF